MSEYKFFQTQRGPNGFAAILRRGTARSEAVESPFRLAVGLNGVSINGSYGTNPSKEEMRETLELMREAVAEWDKLYAAS